MLSRKPIFDTLSELFHIRALSACSIFRVVALVVAFGAITPIGLADSLSGAVADSSVDSLVDSAATLATTLAVPAANSVTSDTTATGLSRFLKVDRTNTLLFLALFSAVILIYTRRARAGQKLFVRKIAGLEAVEEAVGRATEMGRAVMFIPGIQELDEIQTIAAVTILGRVARITAEYETPLMVPVRYPLIFAGAQEIVQQAYTEVGRKDSYNKDMVRYVAGEQFAFTAHVNGYMVREKPAAIVYMGGFFAESLLLTETGFAAGSIQIAGTAEVAQLPFFVATCDYTLLGEELYAASAYLSHEPLLLGGLKGQDFIKVFIIVAIVAGVIAVSVTSPDEGAGKVMRALWESATE